MKEQLLCLVLFCLLFFISSIQADDKTAETFAYFSDDIYRNVNCGCYKGDHYYTCTSFSTFTGVATFTDPLPTPKSGHYQVIKSVKIQYHGDPFCENVGGFSYFALDLTLNNQPLSPLHKWGIYNCDCQCEKISNTTTFSSLGGLPGYNFGGSNAIRTTVLGSTVACYQGYDITLTYSEQSGTMSPSPSPSHNGASSSRTATPSTAPVSHTPSPSHNSPPSSTPTPSTTREAYTSTPTPSPSHMGASSTPSPTSQGSNGYKCCVYVSSTGNGDYDVTCVVGSDSCNPQSGYSVITSYPVSDCNVCFNT